MDHRKGSFSPGNGTESIEKIPAGWDEPMTKTLNFLRLERALSPNTVAAYRVDLTQCARHFSATAPSDVKRGDITNYLLHLKDAHLNPSSISRKLVALKVFFRFLLGENLISSDPSALLDSPRLMRGLPEVLNIDEVNSLLSIPSAKQKGKGIRDRALLELLYATGMRVSEAVKLKINDLNQEGG